MKKVLSHLSRIIIMIAVLTVGLCSSVMNFRFGYHLGSTSFDGFILGTLSVSLDARPVPVRVDHSREAPRRVALEGQQLCAGQRVTCADVAIAIVKFVVDRSVL